MDYRKFDDWSKAGFRIIKGSKATWIDGVPMFSEKQVAKRPPRSYASYGDYSGYYTYDTESDEAVHVPPEQPEIVYFADGSGYVNYGGPCGPLYFDKFGNT